MLDAALTFLKDELSAALALRTGSDTVKVLLSKVAAETGKYAFAAHFTHYDQAVKYLALFLTSFQSHPVFTAEQYPALSPALRKLNLELVSLNYEHLNQIWAFVGAKQFVSHPLYPCRSPHAFQPGLSGIWHHRPG